MNETGQYRCVIAGGGPAGMMCGFLLARAGVPVAVCEKHGDFNRDFRGDTIHPSTFELMHELGLLPEFLQQPHDEVKALTAVFNGEEITIADFSHLPTHCKFVGMMPQWDFLNFIAAQGRKLPAFHLLMRTTVTGLIEENGVVKGVRATSQQGEPLELRADLVIAADGRHSSLREHAGMKVNDFGAAIDVLWMRLSRKPDDPAQTFGFFKDGRLFVALNRQTYWQTAMVIPKGGYPAIQAAGLADFHQSIADIAPFLTQRTEELKDWSQISLLSVQINRLERWARAGLQCIGDAAHAMSPAGGVGINLAIQDAVATANLLTEKLRAGSVTLADLEMIQARREWPTKLIQTMQVFIHKRINGVPTPPRTQLPLLLRLLRRFPYLRRFPARFVGMGPRPEHVQTKTANV